MKGHVYKRCRCPQVRDDAGRRVTCPKPHGSWCWVADVPGTDGQPRRQQTRAGYKTKRDAEQGLALDAGLHPKVVQQLLGHSNWAVTMDLYSHRVDRLQREATSRLEALVHVAPAEAVG